MNNLEELINQAYDEAIAICDDVTESLAFSPPEMHAFHYHRQGVELWEVIVSLKEAIDSE